MSAHQPARWQGELRGEVALLTYRREPDNVLGFSGLAELDAALELWGSDERVKAVVLTGGVPGYFVAHADLADVAALVSDADPGPYGPEMWRVALERIATLDVPVVAAVNGQAWGGGCELALACLWRVAAVSAHLRFVEVAHGAIPGAGGTQRLPRIVGLPTAARLVLGGEVVTSGEALSIGLVEAVLPDDDFIAHVLDWLTPVVAAPRHSLMAAKRALVQGSRLPLLPGLDLEQRLFRDVLRSRQTRALHDRN